MVGERTADVEFWKVTGHRSRLRCGIFNWFPFWQGQNPQFWLTIEAQVDINHDTKFLYSIQYSNGEKDPVHQISISPTINKGKREIKLVPMPLIYTGDTFLVVAEILNNSTTSEYQTAYSFNTTNRSWLFLAIVTGVLAGIFATIGNCIIHISN